MNDALGPRAKAFLQTVASDDDPTLADCERVHANLKMRLAVGIGAMAGAGLVAKQLGTAAAGESIATAGTAAGAASVPVAATGTAGATAVAFAGKVGAG